VAPDLGTNPIQVISRRMPEIWIGLETHTCDNDPDSCIRRNDQIKGR